MASSHMTPSHEQQVIHNFGRNTSESLLIGALAGSGKTTTLVELLKVIAERSILVLAFNKRIADTMQRRMPSMPRGKIVHVKTLHAAGYGITRHHFPQLTIDREVTEQRIRDAANGAPFRVLGAATRLLRIVKDFQHAPQLDADLAWELGFDFDCFNKLASQREEQWTVEVVQKAYLASQRVDKAIDFPDQGWLPLVLGLDPPSRYKAILLDEAQDVNENQFAMVERLLAPGGRIIACGDLNQEIYTWRGAVGRKVWAKLKTEHKARELPLTITWRCDQAIVVQANEIVPALKVRPGAGLGLVNHLEEDEFFAEISNDETGVEGDGSVFVLSRNNAELLRTALELWRRRVPFNVAQSDDVLGPITAVLQKLMRGDVQAPVPKKGDAEDIETALSLFHARQQRGEARGLAVTKTFTVSRSPVVQSGVAAFRQKLAAWYMTEMMKAQAAGSQSWTDRIEDQHMMIQYALNYVQDPREIGQLLENIFSIDDTCSITLSTVHKAKGLEADHVYLLRETFARYQKRVDREGNPLPIPVEELNVEYVAITRARRKLTWVHTKQP